MSIQHIGGTVIDLESFSDTASENSPWKSTDAYNEQYSRNRPLINRSMQQRLRDGLVLVAGCGSTGGAAVEPLVRLGVSRIRLCEPGSFELSNLNRQSATRADLNSNKADVLRRRAVSINPDIACDVNTEGITSHNVYEMLRGVHVILDGVDVTTMEGWRAKYYLHEAASRLGIPVVVGYDMAGVQYIRTYQYRPGDRPFTGAITLEDLRKESHWALLRQVIPLKAMPVDLLKSLPAIDQEDGFPQLAYTALLFGAAASRIVLCLLCGQPVAKDVVLDLHTDVMPSGARRLTRFLAPLRKARLLARAARTLIPTP